MFLHVAQDAVALKMPFDTNSCIIANFHQWRSKGGGWRWGGKIVPTLKNLGRRKIFWSRSKFFMGGEITQRLGAFVDSRKNFRLPKKGRQRFLAQIGKKISKGAANLRPAPGGRHPSYATVFHTQASPLICALYSCKPYPIPWTIP